MGSKSKKKTTKTELPSWITDASQSAVSRGEQIADREYTPYEGDRVSGLTDNELGASEMARSGFGSATDYYDSGARALNSVQSWTDADHGAYMNPYVQNVVNQQMRGANETFDAKNAELQRTSGMRSAFGGGRQTALENSLNTKHIETAGDIYGVGYANAYDQAQRTHSDEQARAIAQGGAFGQLGQAASGTAGQQIEALSQTGAIERNVDQMQKDFDYGQFIESRDWDVNNLQPLLNAISQAKHGSTQTETTKTSGGGLGAVVGLAATVGGAILGGPAGAALAGKIGMSAGTMAGVAKTMAGVGSAVGAFNKGDGES